MAQAYYDRRRPDGAAPRPRHHPYRGRGGDRHRVEFRRRTLLPLDDVLGCPRGTIPTLSRSALHRCLQRHGISRPPRGDEKASECERFAETRIGYVHIDARESRLGEGELFMFLAIDRVSELVYVALLGANRLPARGRGRLPYRLHTVLTGNGMAFADLAKTRGRRPEIEATFGGRIFGRVREEHGITHKPAKPYRPWTNGQAERTNRTIKVATIKAFHYPDLEALRTHVLAFVTAYDFAKHLKALRRRIDPHHLIPGPHRRCRAAARLVRRS